MHGMINVSAGQLAKYSSRVVFAVIEGHGEYCDYREGSRYVFDDEDEAGEFVKLLASLEATEAEAHEGDPDYWPMDRTFRVERIELLRFGN